MSLIASIPTFSPQGYRSLPRPADPSGEENKGLILLQIDGLGYNTLKEAMDKGYAPHLKQMAESRRYTLESYSCGIPAETIPALSSMFYGVQLPANDWYSKKEKAFIDAGQFERKVQAQAGQNGESGLTTGGTTYLSPISGGTEETAMTYSTLKENQANQGTFKTIVKEVWQDLKLLKRGGYSIAAAVYRFTRDMIKARKYLKEHRQWNTWWDKHYPIMLSLADNVFPAIATEGVKQSMDRGLPVSYVDYTAYDEKAHYYGTNCTSAFESLKKLDSKIGEIQEKLEREHQPYNLVVFSDHGQTPSSLFKDVYGHSLNDYMLKFVNQDREGKRQVGDQDIVTAHAYCLNNIYFNFKAETAGLSEIEAHEVQGKNPLAQYGNTEEIARQIASYARVKETGDLMVFSTYESGKVLDFNDKYTLVSLHGGLGGDQTLPFMLYDSSSGLNVSNVKQSIQLHEKLAKMKCRV
ncbi:MAG: alkaline phosphatase family protein [Armatimonadetes bacterium]|nr:alkaline phosphatase family protein [Armatimonadota bacterium]